MLKMKFDNVDVDGSGAIDADEFFEAIGEVRSPFTDKLFALIGKSYGCKCLLSAACATYTRIYLHNDGVYRVNH